MPRKLPAVVTSWPFALSVFTLLINDFWLKATWPGLVTGKLSDFAGIAMLTLPLLALFSRRSFVVYVGMAAAFAWWKSPLSQTALNTVNALSAVNFGRTVDYTDLLALLVMPLCQPVAMNPDAYGIAWKRGRRLLLAPLIGSALLGLMATSALPVRQTYSVRQADSAVELSRRSAADIVAAVASKHGLLCIDCSNVTTAASYKGNGLEMSYTFPTNSTIEFKVDGWPSSQLPVQFSFFGPNIYERARFLKADLKSAMQKSIKGLEYVEKLD